MYIYTHTLFGPVTFGNGLEQILLGAPKKKLTTLQAKPRQLENQNPPG